MICHTHVACILHQNDNTSEGPFFYFIREGKQIQRIKIENKLTMNLYIHMIGDGLQFTVYVLSRRPRRISRYKGGKEKVTD